MAWGEEHDIDPAAPSPTERMAADGLAKSVREFLKHRSTLNIERMQAALDVHDAARM